jgi:hypothetical protein
MGVVPRVLLPLLAAFGLCGQSFEEHTIATDLRGGYQVVVSDINHDGRPDLIALASGLTDLIWFENTGSAAGPWTRHVIASGLSRMINVVPVDPDGDGIPDLVVAYEFASVASKSKGLVTVLRHEGDVTKPWRAQKIDELPTSHRLRTADFSGNGRRVVVNAALTSADAVPPGYEGNTPLVFYDPHDWKRQFISDANRGVVHGILICDWNGDGRDDVLTASFGGIHVYTLRKDGTWERKEISKGDPAPWPKGGSSDIAVGKLGRKRYLAAIEPWHGGQVVVYAPKREVIDSTLVDGHTILTADLDGDGRDEIVAGCRGGPKSVFLYKRNGSRWERQTVDDGGIAAASCAAADLNGDGAIDLACIGSATANLKWYQNLPARTGTR